MSQSGIPLVGTTMRITDNLTRGITKPFTGGNGWTANDMVHRWFDKPNMPGPAAPPPIPDPNIAVQNEAKQNAQMQGRASTFLSGPSGLTSSNPGGGQMSTARTLLGV